MNHEKAKKTYRLDRCAVYGCGHRSHRGNLLPLRRLRGNQSLYPRRRWHGRRGALRHRLCHLSHRRNGEFGGVDILSNTVKYSGGDLAVSLLPNGAVTFSNSAPSLSRVQAERLFDRFYTVETARNSTGLGLSIAKLLTEEMGGTITAEYENGHLQICIGFL